MQKDLAELEAQPQTDINGYCALCRCIAADVSDIGPDAPPAAYAALFTHRAIRAQRLRNLRAQISEDETRARADEAAFLPETPRINGA